MTLNLQLRVIWQKNFLGVAIDQVNKKGILPITTYYFWPKTEAWEQLKLELDCKPWIQEDEKIKILNRTTDVMKFWQNNRELYTSDHIKSSFIDVKFSTKTYLGL